MQRSMEALEAMGWDDAEAAAQLLGAMTREISVLEYDAPATDSRRSGERCGDS